MCKGVVLPYQSFLFSFSLSRRQREKDKKTASNLSPSPNETIFASQGCLVHFVPYEPSGGWSGGAMVLGKLPVPRRPTNLDNSRARAYYACSRCGWGLFGHFSLIYHFSFLSPALWQAARYRLKYCLKGPLSPKQPTNQRTLSMKYFMLKFAISGKCYIITYNTLLGHRFITAITDRKFPVDFPFDLLPIH